jgi:hypothetical protein
VPCWPRARDVAGRHVLRHACGTSPAWRRQRQHRRWPGESRARSSTLGKRKRGARPAPRVAPPRWRWLNSTSRTCGCWSKTMVAMHRRAGSRSRRSTKVPRSSSGPGALCPFGLAGRPARALAQYSGYGILDRRECRDPGCLSVELPAGVGRRPHRQQYAISQGKKSFAAAIPDERLWLP